MQDADWCLRSDAIHVVVVVFYVLLLLSVCLQVKYTNDHGMLPLHLVGANEGCHAEVALAVLAAYPDAAKKATNAGFHPLHGVCRSEGCSAEVALAILAAYGNFGDAFEASSPACHGPTPLYTHTAHSMFVWACVVATMLTSAIRPPRCPIHIVFLSFPSFSRYPEATTAMAEYDARLPLHYACQNACCPANVVLAVLAVFPEAAERMDMDGNVPLCDNFYNVFLFFPHAVLEHLYTPPTLIM